MSNIEYRDSDYGRKVMAVEPGGVEAIAESDRHIKASNLFAVWLSPNLEFATIYVGALAMIFGLSFTQAILGALIGNVLGAYAQYVLTQDGRYGVPQMVVGRSAFGMVGNIFPAGLNWIAAGIGWFAVNSVSGAFALATLFNWSTTLSLVIVALVQITIAFIGHNLVQKVEKYLMPYLAVVFVLAAIIAFTKGHYGYHNVASTFPGAFLVYTAAVYGYAAGWNPFASDYSRYLEKSQSVKNAGLFAAAGLFISTTVLEIVGAVAVTAGMHAYGANTNPVGDFTHLLPTWLGKLVLLGIVGGSISANVLNIYSGSVSAVTLGIRFSNKASRAVMVILVGVIGFILAHWAMANPTNNLENFLLVMAYWIGPWLGVIAADKILRKGQSVEGLLFTKRENVAGPIAFIVAVVVSIWLFSNQTYYTGVLPKHNGHWGDITFLVGFVLAFGIYWILGAKKARANQ